MNHHIPKLSYRSVEVRMSKSEDYLDGLLNSMEGNRRQEGFGMDDQASATKARGPEDEFLDSFEKEFLLGADADDFIRQFEKELDDMPIQETAEDAQLDFAEEAAESEAGMEGLDDIVDAARKKMEESELFQEPETAFTGADGDMDLMVDTMGSLSELDFPQSDFAETEDTAAASPIQSNEEMSLSLDAPAGFEDVQNDTSDFMDSENADDDDELMNLLQAESDFSDIDDLLDAEQGDGMFVTDGMDDAGDFSLDGLDNNLQADGLQDSASEEAATPKEEAAGEKKRRKAGKKAKKQKQGEEEKGGFFQKLSKLLFGEDEDEEKAKPVKAETPAVTSGIEAFSDENLEILQALGDVPDAAPTSVPEETEDPKAKKKREKKEKQAKEKAEKKAAQKEKKEQAKKEKAEKKAQKAKAPKPPKAPDRTPPLPKKPVILVFVMVASFLVLVILGTNLFGYSNSMANAEKEYVLGNYEAAFQEVAGMEIKEEDLALYEKYRLMANTVGEYSAYQSFMEAKVYDMALDSLIRAVGRCEKYRPDAELYACTGELDKVKGQAVSALSGFGIDETRALALFAESDRKVYSSELYAILEEAGLGVD